VACTKLPKVWAPIKNRGRKLVFSSRNRRIMKIGDTLDSTWKVRTRIGNLNSLGHSLSNQSSMVSTWSLLHKENIRLACVTTARTGWTHADDVPEPMKLTSISKRSQPRTGHPPRKHAIHGSSLRGAKWQSFQPSGFSSAISQSSGAW
jgi:hypothetical protein